MRHRFPLTLLAAALVCAPAAALAATTEERPHREKRSTHHVPKRIGATVSLHVSRHNVLGGERVFLRGRVRPKGARHLKLVVRGPDGGAYRAATRRDGRFLLRWRPRGTGTHRVRAYSSHDRHVRASVSPARRVTAYRKAEASYYGPGLYGNGMACGGTLTPSTLGVAHKYLPCGSKVKLSYGGRQVTVPVVDRGPYVAGREYDLTAATRERLGFPGTGVLLSTK